MDRSRPGTRRAVESVYLTDGHGSVSGGTLVGLTTKDGVLVMADTRTSREASVCSETVQKISQVHPTAVMGSTADLGAVQSFVRTIRSESERYEVSHGQPMDMTALSTVVASELPQRSVPNSTFLLCGVDDDGPHVFTLGRDGSVIEEAYAAVGSGRQVAFGILDAEASPALTMSEARRVAGRAIQSAAERDVQTGVGVHAAEISDDGVDLKRYDSVETLEQ